MTSMDSPWNPGIPFGGPGFGRFPFGGPGARLRGRRRHGPHGVPPEGPFAGGGPHGPVHAEARADGPPPPDGPEHPRGRRRGRFGPPFGPGFGPAFGPGFGPGPRGFGPPRRRRGRRTRGDVRAAVLALVAEQPRHGYEIIQEIAERSGGRWRPSPGSVYPTLSQLEDEGLVRVEQAEGRRVVHLTEEGTRYVAEHRAELDGVWSAYEGSDDEESPDAALWEQLGQLHAATQQVMAAGTPEQIAQATAALTEARKTIYRLLAE